MMSEQLKPVSHTELLIDNMVSLKALEGADADLLFEQVASNREYLAEYLPWVNKTNTPQDSLGFIQKTIKDRQEGGSYGFGVYCEGDLVGHASLMHVLDGERPEIGYWISEDQSGKGIASKAANRLTEFGFETLGLEEIVIKARPSNIASNKIAENIGYELIGTELDESDLKVNIWRKS